jgi:RNA polymerase sigma-70 factor (sigma-E family)
VQFGESPLRPWPAGVSLEPEAGSRLITVVNHEVDAVADPAVGGGGSRVSDSDFTAFYREHSLWAARLAYLLTADRDLAEDLMQEAFLGLYPRFDTVENPRAYVRVSLVHIANRRRVRDRGRSVAQRLVAIGDTATGSANEMFDAIAALPPKQRAVIVLRYFEDLSEREISAALGCAPGTVKSLASRAIDRLRKEITR